MLGQTYLQCVHWFVFYVQFTTFYSSLLSSSLPLILLYPFLVADCLKESLDYYCLLGPDVKPTYNRNAVTVARSLARSRETTDQVCSLSLSVTFRIRSL
jgi:hypothetical protein